MLLSEEQTSFVERKFNVVRRVWLRMMTDFRLPSRIIVIFIQIYLFYVSCGCATRFPHHNFHFPSRPVFSLPTKPSLVAASALTNHSSGTGAVSIAASTLSNVHQSARSAIAEPLTYLQTMAAGALSRSIAQTLLHPAYTYKTILQLKVADIDTIKKTLTFGRLLRGIDAQFLMSVPHGAFHFYVIDRVKRLLAQHMSPRWNFLADFTSSAVSTLICSIISTPQMVLTDRLMAGLYPSMAVAISSIWCNEGALGFYRGWWPALAQKIPSYGLTWVFFQQLQRSYTEWARESPSHEGNFILGALAAAGSVAVMIPMDTIKTRLVLQTTSGQLAYRGVTDCFVRILREEGIGTFYRALPPRLVAVVPMIAIQFGIYEAMKVQFRQQNRRKQESLLRDGSVR